MADPITIRIPAALRAQAGNQESVAVAGGSVKEVLAGLTLQYPELGKRLFKNAPEGGGQGASGGGVQLNRFLNVYVNDEDIRFLSDLETALKPGDEVSIVPAIAGG